MRQKRTLQYEKTYGINRGNTYQHQGTSAQEDIMIMNIQAPSNKALKCIEQEMREQ